LFIYVSGGVRSGKSRYAQTEALKLAPDPVYIATARIWDEDFAERVARHKNDRGQEWTTFEAYKDISALPLTGRVIVVDCVTLWLSSFFVDTNSDLEAALNLFKAEIDALYQIDAVFIFISNELGMGMHADTELGRKFADLQGWANQYLANLADQAYFMVSGIPLKIR